MTGPCLTLIARLPFCLFPAKVNLLVLNCCLAANRLLEQAEPCFKARVANLFSQGRPSSQPICMEEPDSLGHNVTAFPMYIINGNGVVPPGNAAATVLSEENWLGRHQGMDQCRKTSRQQRRSSFPPLSSTASQGLGSHVGVDSLTSVC